MAGTTIKENWNNMLGIGEQAEDRFKEFMSGLGYNLVKQQGNFKSYDFECSKTGIKFELKYDIKSKQTGNYAIEIRFRNKASGISTTKSDFFVFYEDDYVFLKTERLKNFIKANWQVLKNNLVKGGDDMEAEMILIPKELIRGEAFCSVNYFKRI